MPLLLVIGYAVINGYLAKAVIYCYLAKAVINCFREANNGEA